jgi:hypothetical protein
MNCCSRQGFEVTKYPVAHDLKVGGDRSLIEIMLTTLMASTMLHSMFSSEILVGNNGHSFCKLLLNRGFGAVLPTHCSPHIAKVLLVIG